MPTQLVPTRRRRDIIHKRRYIRDRLDRVQIDTDEEGLLRAVFFGNLEPTTGSGTEIDDDF